MNLSKQQEQCVTKPHMGKQLQPESLRNKVCESLFGVMKRV